MRQLYYIAFIIFFLATAVEPFSTHAQDITNLGGDLTTDLPGAAAIQAYAPNVTDESRRLLQIAGFDVFHKLFSKQEGLGPRFVHSSCGGCHVNNGRGPIRFPKSRTAGSTMVIKVSLPGLQDSGAPRNVPGIGEQLLDHTISGSKKIHIDLQFTEVPGQYPDGTKYKLRKPDLKFTIDGMSQRKIVSSLRMSPAIIGPGLLEAIPDSVILELNDPDDLDGDGISGHPNYVPDVRSGEMAIGRFGFRASHTTVEQQSCAALLNDIGITNPLFSIADKTIELSDDDLNILTTYQKIAGVPRASDQDNESVIAGKALFQTIGCHSCHRITMTTADYDDPELSNQEFHPFTDLLLHDMGRGLADKRAEFSAKGSEWRTTPLWGLGFTRRLAGGKTLFLHDGRARSIEEAILWHGGEARAAQTAFKALSKAERDALLAFLDSL